MTVSGQLKVIQRGTVEILVRDDLIQKLERSQVTGRALKVKLGLDPTAPDLHIGHTVVLQKLKQFQDLGHEVIFLIGDFTAMIGDPSGRSETRKPLTREEILRNAKTYERQIFKILDPKKTKIEFNSTWLSKLSSEEIIRLSSKYTVARILERDDFSMRYKDGKPIGIHELLYPLFQGYDSVALKADLELGGTDQKFNLLVGRYLQKEYGQEPQVVITMPILEGTDGVMKMSKSLGNYIGIDEAPDEIFGKVMSISDDLMWRYYELLSDLNLGEIETLKETCISGRMNPRDAKIQLAKELVGRFHGIDLAQEAWKSFDAIFKQHVIPSDIPLIPFRWESEKEWLPRIIVSCGLASSTSEAKRLISAGAVQIDGNKILDSGCSLPPTEMFIKVGKRRFAKIVPI